MDGGNKIMEERAVRELIEKLEKQGDVTIYETDQIYPTMRRLSDAVMGITSKRPAIEESKLQELLSKDFPVPALKEWYEVVARKIEEGQRGNFIFSIPFVFKSARFYNYVLPAIEMLKERGDFEDRIKSIWINQRVYTLIPEPFQSLFKWIKHRRMYVLNGDRAGFFRYPLPLFKNCRFRTFSRLFERMSMIPIVAPQEKISTMSPRADVTEYILEYLEREVPLVNINAVSPLFGETVVFTNKEGFLTARKAFEVSLEELTKNAVEQNIIDKNVAKKLLKDNEYMTSFPDKEFTEASVKYIGEMVRLKMEREAEHEAIKNDNLWLDETR